MGDKYKIFNLNLLTKRISYFQLYLRINDFNQHKYIYLNVSYPDCLVIDQVMQLFDIIQNKKNDYGSLNDIAFIGLLHFTEYFDIKIYRKYLSTRLKHFPDRSTLTYILRFKEIFALDSLKVILTPFLESFYTSVDDFLKLKPKTYQNSLRSKKRKIEFHKETIPLTCCHCDTSYFIPFKTASKFPQGRCCTCRWCIKCSDTRVISYVYYDY